MHKPFAPACERNQGPILQQLKMAFATGPQRILEIGSGTGQHGVHFTTRQADWHWQCSDRPEHLAGIGQWVVEADCPRLPAPVQLDVDAPADWDALPSGWDWLYTANTLHIMPWTSVENFFSSLPRVLGPRTGLVVYGPFNRAGAYTSDSNAAFDQHLKQQDPAMGIRDLESITALAADCGLHAEQVLNMPANNFLLVFRPRD